MSTTDDTGTATTTTGALTDEEREHRAAVALDNARCLLTRGYAANDPEIREIVRTVLRAGDVHHPTAATGDAVEGAVVDVMAALSRWLHPDLDDWPTWRIDDMIGEIIDAATTDHRATHDQAARIEAQASSMAFYGKRLTERLHGFFIGAIAASDRDDLERVIAEYEDIAAATAEQDGDGR